MIERLAVVGMGLIGGSLARALRDADYCREIIAAGRREAPLRRARETGLIDGFELDPAAAVAGADMVVLAVPLGATREQLAAIAPALEAHATVTDVGSAKRSVVADAEAVLGEAQARFVPGHPVAGTERSGLEASFAELFDGRRTILTPTRATDPAAIARVRRMWEAAGAEVVEMSPEHHDELLGATSHLPHMLAYALVDSLARGEQGREAFAFAAGGFRDFTRIASSDPVMWRDICLANADRLVAELEGFSADLETIREALRSGDGATLEDIFERAKQARDRWVEP